MVILGCPAKRSPVAVAVAEVVLGFDRRPRHARVRPRGVETEVLQRGAPVMYREGWSAVGTPRQEVGRRGRPSTHAPPIHHPEGQNHPQKGGGSAARRGGGSAARRGGGGSAVCSAAHAIAATPSSADSVHASSTASAAPPLPIGAPTAADVAPAPEPTPTPVPAAALAAPAPAPRGSPRGSASSLSSAALVSAERGSTASEQRLPAHSSARSCTCARVAAVGAHG